MKRGVSFAILGMVLLFAAVFANAQAIITPTTLSAAVSDSKTTTVQVASATGISANTTYLYIDAEFMAVTSVNGTFLGVVRGYAGTAAKPHLSGENVFFGPANYFVTGLVTEPSGSCTRSSSVALPRINVRTGVFSDCLGGQWVNGLNTQQQPYAVRIPDPAGTAYTSINTNGTTLDAGTMYCTEMFVPHNMLLTGLGVLNGTAAATDKHLLALFDSTGNLLANTATAGTVASGVSTYQQIPFTAKYFAVGPAKYFGCLQTNGANATVRMVVTGTQDTYLTKGQTGITFGTIPKLTVPTTFTTAVGPYFELY